MIGRKKLGVWLAVLSFLVFTFSTWAQKSVTPPPGEPGQQGCLVRNGVTICDPALIELILRYNLEVLPAFPPGVVPIVVETLAELEAVLSALVGSVAVVGGDLLDPTIGPYDPGIGMSQICVMQWDSELGRFDCVAYPPQPPSPPPAPPSGNGSGSGCATCPPPSSAHPVECATTFRTCREVKYWVVNFGTCLVVDVVYYPGERFTQVSLSYNTWKLAVGFTVEIETQPASYMLLDGGKSLRVRGMATATTYFLFKGFPISGSETFELQLWVWVPRTCGR